MHRSRFLLHVALVGLCAACPPGFAAEVAPPATAGDDPTMAVAIAKETYLFACRQAAPLFDIQANRHKIRGGWTAAYAATDIAHARIVTLLNDAIDVENQKGAAKNESFIRGCNDRLSLIESDWNNTRKAWADADLQWATAITCWNATTTAGYYAMYQYQYDMEANLIAAKIDPKALVSFWAALEKRIVELHATAQQAADAVKNQQQAWGSKISDIQSFLASNVAIL